jgi:AraC-like DNA-binding protein
MQDNAGSLFHKMSGAGWQEGNTSCYLVQGTTSPMDRAISKDAPNRASLIDRQWVHTVVTTLQLTIGQIPLADVEGARAIIVSAAHAMPAAANQAETLVLCSLLHDTASKCGKYVHDRAHAGHAQSACDFVPAVLLDAHWSTAHDPRQVLASWADVFFTAFLDHHPPSIARRAAQILQERYSQSWTAISLAKRLGVGVAGLRETFAQEFGRSIREYQRLLRIVAALGHVRTDKVDAVAFEIGYRSKKNFYRALYQVAGLTPTLFRELPSADSERLVELLRLQLVSPTQSETHDKS